MPFQRRLLPSIAYLHECFDFDGGVAYWKQRPLEHFKSRCGWINFNRKCAGKIAGSPRPEHYITVTINRRVYYLHKIIYKLKCGTEPTFVDHIDGNKHNNHPDNLREATQSQNFFNSKIQKNNKCGFKGVHKCRDTGHYRAVIGFNKKIYSLGSFKTPEEAHEAYFAAAVRFAGEFASRGK